MEEEEEKDPMRWEEDGTAGSCHAATDVVVVVTTQSNTAANATAV